MFLHYYFSKKKGVAQCRTTQTVQYSTLQHSTVQAQCSTAQYSTSAAFPLQYSAGAAPHINTAVQRLSTGLLAHAFQGLQYDTARKSEPIRTGDLGATSLVLNHCAARRHAKVKRCMQRSTVQCLNGYKADTVQCTSAYSALQCSWRPWRDLECFSENRGLGDLAGFRVI